MIEFSVTTEAHLLADKCKTKEFLSNKQKFFKFITLFGYLMQK